jgi:superfamily II DNA or RNA helicase
MHRRTRDLNLWPHQSKALSVLSRFLDARAGHPGSSALIQMPTGTGKSGVIAVAAQRLVSEGDVLLLAPWDALVDQLTRDVSDRFWVRIKARPPTTKRVIRLFPATAAEALAKERFPAIWTATIATLQQLHRESHPAYSELARRVVLVIVDEGHYEPAPSWAKAVRELGRPTALFTATPYRNDFKFFDVDTAFSFLYSHARAEKDQLVRSVRFEAREFDSVSSFCDELLDAWKRLFKKTPRPRVIVRCATKNSVQAVTNELSRRGVSVIGVHERFDETDGTLRKNVPNPDSEDAQFWVHQNKLIEGIDHHKFRLVAFFEPLSSERAFVQQVGRVLRNPDLKARQYAWIFHNPHHRLEESWDAYRHYDTLASTEPLVRSARDFASLQPPIQYVAGRFREQLDITSPNVHEDFDYPRSTSVYIVPEDYPLDNLTQAVEQEWDEYDFELQPVISPTASTRVHAYIAIRNSPLLLRKSFAEYEVGLTIYRKIRTYLFFHDSRGKAPKALDSLRRVALEPLQRLFAGTDARLSSVSLLNTNLSRHSSRRRVLHGYSIGEIGPDLADHAQFASATTGLTEAPNWVARRMLTRYVGFTHGRISDRVGGSTPFDKYMRWLEYLADALDNPRLEPLPVFDRYAEVIEAPNDPSPINILLDFDQNAFEGVSTAASQGLSIEDLCVPVSSGIFECMVNGLSYHVNVRWDGAAGRYRLECAPLDQTFLMKNTLGNRGAESLIQFLNREQGFRIIPASASNDYCIYAGGRFCRPRLPLWGRTRPGRLDLLRILEPIVELASTGTEKGEVGSAGSKGWAQGSLFSLIDSMGSGTPMEDAFDGVSLLICDDMGTEIADFIALDESGPRVIAIHAKAFSTPKPLSASALHEISSQALKNLVYFQPYFVGEPKNLRLWDKQWNGLQGRVASRIRRGRPITGRGAWNKIRSALLDPRAIREVWLVLGQGTSRAAFEAETQKRRPAPEAVQMLYSLQATWGAVSSVGGRLRVFCSP